MKATWLILSLITLSIFVKGQNYLNKINLNEVIIPFDWTDEIQKTNEWEFVELVSPKKKKVKFDLNKRNGKIWNFKKKEFANLPNRWVLNLGESLKSSVKYFKENKTFIITTTIRRIDIDTTYINDVIEIFEVAMLTNEYLVLDVVENQFCFDYTFGRKLTKYECDEKNKNALLVGRIFGNTTKKNLTLPRLLFKKRTTNK